MSNYYDLHCETCSQDLGTGHGSGLNHGEEELAELLNRRPALEAAGKLAPDLLIEIGGSPMLAPAWFARHADHDIVVRSEYGYNHNDCSIDVACPHCGHKTPCKAPRGHAGDHVPRRG